ncbi:response regulator transcription factor [Luteolibacter yonseiensis]|uniref:response regulator transcription factor n=1 Tax=Luteolibacter yonseiensis TaxID=1144680 RepID=UPI002D808975|nr:response regulator [Luteolibacter yonseiensis]
MSDRQGRTVYVVDDDTSFLLSLTRMLRASGFSVKAYASATEFLTGHPEDARGCVIADLHMPEMSGIELQEQLVKTCNPLPVVFLTGEGDLPSSVTAMRQGAEDFLAKLAPSADLLAALDRALARDERERKQRSHKNELGARFRKLTPRDHEVLLHVLQGRLNKEIAADLGIDERSVKRHRTSIMAKLEIRSVVELARLAQEVGISVLPSPRP